MAGDADYVLATFGTGVGLVAAFAGCALGYGFWYRRQRCRPLDTEAFITARRTQQFGRIAWAFFCATFGARMFVSGPAALAATQGIAAVGAAALAAGLPILLLALAGSRAVVAVPSALSVSDWAACRFGPVVKLMVAGVALLSMGAALVEEYAALGALAHARLGAQPWAAPAALAAVTAVTASFGGLRASLAVHQLRGAVVYALLVAAAVYVGTTYKGRPIPSPLPSELGPTAAAGISFATLSATASAGALFSEALWQRVWAAESRFVLGTGACAGCGLAMGAALTLSFGGWLAAAWGLDGGASPFLALFGAGHVHTWGGVVATLLALAMSAGAVDSLQQGVAATLGAHFFKGSVMLTRFFATAANMGLLALALTKGSSVGQLLPVVSMLCCCAAPPVALGFLRCARRIFTETSCIAGIVTGILSLSALGAALHWDPADARGSIAAGSEWAWRGSGGSDWRAVLAALVGSLAGGLGWSAAAAAVERVCGVRGPGVSRVLMKLPGMGLLTAAPGWPRGSAAARRAWQPAGGSALVHVEVRPGAAAHAFWAGEDGAAAGCGVDAAACGGRATPPRAADDRDPVRRPARVKIELSPRGSPR